MYHVGFSCEDDEDPRDAKNRLTEWVTDIVYMNLGCDDFKALTTGSGNFRYEVAKTVPYKGNRKDMKRPKHLEELKKHIKRLGAVEVEGIEADDAVAIELFKDPEKYIIVHVDKDLDQLPGVHYNPVKDLSTQSLNLKDTITSGLRCSLVTGLTTSLALQASGLRRLRRF